MTTITIDHLDKDSTLKTSLSTEGHFEMMTQSWDPQTLFSLLWSSSVRNWLCTTITVIDKNIAKRFIFFTTVKYCVTCPDSGQMLGILQARALALSRLSLDNFYSCLEKTRLKGKIPPVPSTLVPGNSMVILKRASSWILMVGTHCHRHSWLENWSCWRLDVESLGPGIPGPMQCPALLLLLGIVYCDQEQWSDPSHHKRLTSQR